MAGNPCREQAGQQRQGTAAETSAILWRARDTFRGIGRVPRRPGGRRRRRALARMSVFLRDVCSARHAVSLIEAKRKLKKEPVLPRLTAKWRFPGYEGQPWREVRLGEVAAVNAESLSEGTEPSREFRYVDLSAVSEGRITLPDRSQRFEQLPSRARRVARKYDIIMSTVRPNLLGYALCDSATEYMVFSTGFAVISVGDSGDARFVYQSLFTDDVQRQIHGLITGSNYPALNVSDVQALRLWWPSERRERRRIADALTACDMETDILTRKLTALQQQKEGLMQRLLVGQVRTCT